MSCLELTRLRHAPIALVGEWLRNVVRGYYRYHAVPGNLPRLHLFRWRLQWLWWRALSRRGQRCRVQLVRLNRVVQICAGAISNDRPYRECAEHVRQLEGESPFHNLMEVK